MNWYNQLLCKLEFAVNGAVAENVTAAVNSGLIKDDVAHYLDSSVSVDVAKWFGDLFIPWFKNISLQINSVEGVNQAIKLLTISRAYYRNQANEQLFSSLVQVYTLKSIICEALAEAIGKAYQESMGMTGDEGKTMFSVTASEYTNQGLENFTWPGTTIVLTPKFKTMNDETVDQEKCKNSTQQYLPWVIASAFGLIAWTAAASKNQK